MTDEARSTVPAVADNRSSRHGWRKKKRWHQGYGRQPQPGQEKRQSGKPLPKIFFCGDPAYFRIQIITVKVFQC